MVSRGRARCLLMLNASPRTSQAKERKRALPGHLGLIKTVAHFSKKKFMDEFKSVDIACEPTKFQKEPPPRPVVVLAQRFRHGPPGLGPSPGELGLSLIHI